MTIYYKCAVRKEITRGHMMMKLREVLSLLGGELLTPGISLETECSKVFASDLMSDVLAFTEPGSLLMTGLVNSHVVRTACLVDATAIVIVQGKRPDMKVVDEARENNLPIISTGCSMFEACSRISRSFPEGKQ
jgi:predicted transcriptional regulator